MFKLFGEEELFSILLEFNRQRIQDQQLKGPARSSYLLFLPCRGSPAPSSCPCKIISSNSFILVFLFQDKLSSTSCEGSAIAYEQPAG